MSSADDMHTSDDMPEDGTDAPSAKERSSLVGQGCADHSLAQVVLAEISAYVFTRYRECKDCSRHCMGLYEAKLEMVLALRSCQSHSVRRNTDYDVRLSCRLHDALFGAIEAFRAMGDNARCHVRTHYHDYAMPATTIRRPFRVQPPSKPAAPTTPGHTRSAAPPVTRTMPGPLQDTATLETTMMPASSLVAAASTSSMAAPT
ncbi:hypothetical protein GGI09_002088 [Coemansia sp. S100]|nr:hypothetical protein GGI09_002088 [Coemansia sp. S100]